MKRKIAILLFCMMSLTITVFAQPGACPSPEKKRKIQERVQSMKMWKLTETLELTEEQAARFFPRFRVFDEEFKRINKDIDRTVEELGEAARTGQDDKRLEELIAEYERLSRAAFEKRLDFIKSTEDILTKNQQARLVVFEQKFPKRMREIIREIKAGHGPGPGSPPHDEPRGKRRGDW